MIMYDVEFETETPKTIEIRKYIFEKFFLPSLSYQYFRLCARETFHPNTSLAENQKTVSHTLFCSDN